VPLKHSLGADHVVIAVRDLNAAAARWKRLGFALSPRGAHSPQMGTANYTIVFREDYLELLGVVAATNQNKPTRNFLSMGEGIERTAFTSDDAAGGVAELKSRGVDAVGPLHFGRPVDFAGGGKGEAKFSVFLWPPHEAPGGMHIFACQHLTPDAVWIPELNRHANGAIGIARIEILSAQPKAAAEHLGRLIDEPVSPARDAWRVLSGGKRAVFVFYDQASFAKRYPDAVRAGAAREGAAALVVGTTDLAAAADMLGSLAFAHGDVVSAPATAANGVVVSFMQQ
jgi:catechol 2,3-dioxygenase-like lactoylglutathione lyase family enzyme